MQTEHSSATVRRLHPRCAARSDAMHANVGHRWSMAELAAVAGASGRTLQRQFLSFLGKTPRAVLRDLGFERARRELLQGRAGTRVMDVALRCGFPHFGRFSVEYRRRYGETPSQTLKRQAMFAATLGAMTSLFVPPRDRPDAGLWADRGGRRTSETASISPPSCRPR